MKIIDATKVPVTIQAVHFTPDNRAEAEKIASWCGGSLAGVKLPIFDVVVRIETLEGEMRADYGDYIIKGVKGEFYPCKADIFEATYSFGSTGEKTLHNSDISGTRKNVPDVKVVGNGDMFKLLCKASSEREGWMKSTKALETSGGCIVQVTTQQKNPDGSYAVAEALTFAPGVVIRDDVNGGRMLAPMFTPADVMSEAVNQA